MNAPACSHRVHQAGRVTRSQGRICKDGVFGGQRQRGHGLAEALPSFSFVSRERGDEPNLPGIGSQTHDLQGRARVGVGASAHVRRTVPRFCTAHVYTAGHEGWRPGTGCIGGCGTGLGNCGGMSAPGGKREAMRQWLCGGRTVLRGCSWSSAGQAIRTWLLDLLLSTKRSQAIHVSLCTGAQPWSSDESCPSRSASVGTGRGQAVHEARSVCMSSLRQAIKACLSRPASAAKPPSHPCRSFCAGAQPANRPGPAIRRSASSTWKRALPPLGREHRQSPHNPPPKKRGRISPTHPALPESGSSPPPHVIDHLRGLQT